MVKRYCKQCGKELVRNKRKNKTIKRGWNWEIPSKFLNRSFCNQSCSIKFKNLNSDRYIHWTKEIILKQFNKIKTEKKWKIEYLYKNYPALSTAIKKYYGKNAWTKFLIEKDRQPIFNHLNQKYKVTAKLLLKYWKEEEIYNGIGKVFIYGTADGIPGISQDFRYIHKGLNYLIKQRVIRIFKKGRSDIGRSNFPTQYVLLKQRI